MLSAVTVLVLAGSAASAEASPAEAERLFRSGRASAKRGDFAAACADFAESFRLDPAAGTELNLSECEEKLGRVASAWGHLGDAVARLPPKDDRLEHARARLELLKRRVPHLVVRLKSGAPNGTSVTRDGVVLGPSVIGTPEPVDPGEHTVIVRAPDHDEGSFRVTITEAETRTLDVEAGAAHARPEPAQPVANTVSNKPAADFVDAGSGQRTIALIVGGVGIVGIGVGAVTGLMAMGHRSDRDAACGGDFPNCTDPTRANEIKSSQEDLKTMGTLSTIGFGVGAAALVTGVVLYVTAPSPSSAATRLVPTPLVARDGLGFGLTRAW
jgi:hypothetical protein